MKRFTVAACAAVLAVAMATPSIAADIVAPRPIYKGPAYVAPVFTWSGFYVGLNAGYGFGTSSWSGGGLGTGGFSTNGWLIGGTLGYNLQTGNWVWGLETDLDWSGIKTDGNCSRGSNCEVKNDWLGTTRLRLGLAMDRWMPYLTGGAAYGGVKADVNGNPGSSDTRFGWTVGGGVEYAFASPWTAKLEYLFVDLGNFDCGSRCGGGQPDNVNFHSHIVRAGLNYRF
jgi:outer membrane immunogenic protein